MKLPTRVCIFLLAFLIYLLATIPAVQASKNDRHARDVRLSYVQGDVRLSRGNGKHPDLNKPWEQVQSGELVQQGFALATGDGRAEIAFEDGSAVYLAENSLLLFTELSAPDEHNLTRMILPTGTATFSLRPIDGEEFYIHTPTDALMLSQPEAIYSRIDAYLDATAITPQGDGGEHVVPVHDFDENETAVWPSQSSLHVAKGQTILLRQGEILNRAALRRPTLSSALDDRIFAGTAGLEEMATRIEQLLRRVPREQLQMASSSVQIAWDTWVSSRVQNENVALTAGLKAAGLSLPIPGLVNLYQHGTFFDCEYGKCWEPIAQDPQMDSAQRPQTLDTQTAVPASNQTTSVFQPVTVQWQETWQPWCGPWISRSISRVARTPEELQKLLLEKRRAENSLHPSRWNWEDCYAGFWFSHHGHYARVITPISSPPATPPRTRPTRKPPKHPPKCEAISCQPGIHPHPVWVRAGKEIGFVPRHPKDVPGKPPLNLQSGMLVPRSTTNPSLQLVEFDASAKMHILDRTPKEFHLGEASFHGAAVSAPEIRAHLMPENRRPISVASTNYSSSSSSATNHVSPTITYDYKHHSFTMPSSTTPGGHATAVAIGGIDRHGNIASFADGHSARYAASFDRSSVATNYRGESHNSVSYSAGSHDASSSAGGGHRSGPYSEGGHNSGSSGASHNAGSYSGGSPRSGSYSGGSHSTGGSSGGYSGGGGGSSHSSSSGGSSGGGGGSGSSSSSSVGSGSPRH